MLKCIAKKVLKNLISAILYIYIYISDIVTIPKELYKTKVTLVTIFFRKECNELLVIRHPILILMVPLQLLIT
jgi:hypothetical protein